MKKTKRTVSLAMAALLAVACAVPAAAANAKETTIVLSDNGITVDGKAAPTDPASAVYVGADIVYYEEGHDDTYGEGTAADEHSAEEAAAHTVVTITQPGTYRISGTLSAGQIAVDLGADASQDPSAVVTLILNGIDITCTVAPAVIFYNVYECGVVDADNASPIVDTSNAGANVIIADGSVNNVDGAYVARIYKEGTTKKLHKYDAAFYAKMSMNISGETLGNGILNITTSNEGLDSELHLTVSGGIINIHAQNDGINTNEDGVSVTTINGGILTVDGGFSVEGDGIDSNGYLVINGGTIYATAHSVYGDGGIDADMDILINGGTVIASGKRNDATGIDSQQTFIELNFASTQTAGTPIRIEDAQGNELFSYAPARDFQSLTVSLADLAENMPYYVYANGILQQYASTGMGFRPDGMVVDWKFAEDGMEFPDGFEPGEQRPGGGEWQIGGNWPEGMTPPEGFNPNEQRPGGGNWQIGGEPPEGMTLPDGFEMGGTFPGGTDNQAAAPGEGIIEFVLTDSARYFSGVSDSIEATGKTAVSFSINDGTGIKSAASGETAVLEDIQALLRNGNAANIPAEEIQITISDIPSENFTLSCLLSEGADAIAGIMPTDDGLYQLTITVLSSNEEYAGTTQWFFRVGGLPFVDVDSSHAYYESIQTAYENGWMNETTGNSFSPNQKVSRGAAVTALGLLANADTAKTATFTDVAANSAYAPYVGWAEQNGIVNGYGNGLFGPEDSVTRQQMCVMLANYAKTLGITLPTGTLDYKDSASVADWSQDAVAMCAAAGLLDNIAPAGSNLNPGTALTRAELAEMLAGLAALVNG